VTRFILGGTRDLSVALPQFGAIEPGPLVAMIVRGIRKENEVNPMQRIWCCSVGGEELTVLPNITAASPTFE